MSSIIFLIYTLVLEQVGSLTTNLTFHSTFNYALRVAGKSARFESLSKTKTQILQKCFKVLKQRLLSILVGRLLFFLACIWLLFIEKEFSLLSVPPFEKFKI